MCTLQKYSMKECTGQNYLSIGHNGTLFEYRNEQSGSIKGGEFINLLSEYQLPRNDSAPWSLLLNSASC